MDTNYDHLIEDELRRKKEIQMLLSAKKSFPYLKNQNLHVYIKLMVTLSLRRQ